MCVSKEEYFKVIHSHLSLLFITALIPLSVILRQAVQGYRFQQERRVDHLLYMEDLELYRKSKDDLEALMDTVRIPTDDIS